MSLPLVTCGEERDGSIKLSEAWGEREREREREINYHCCTLDVG